MLFHRYIRDGLPEETYEQRSKAGEGLSPADTYVIISFDIRDIRYLLYSDIIDI